jgi:hypothetical protein
MKMSLEDSKKLAIKYRVDDLKSALIPNTRLSKMLQSLEPENKPISIFGQELLRKQGLFALLRYAKKEISFEEFVVAADPEKSERCKSNEEIERRKQAEQKLKDEELRRKNEAMQLRLKKRSQARDEQYSLREEYDLAYFIERDDFPKVMKILRNAQRGLRFREDDVIWLNTEGEDYFTDDLRARYHWLEAEFHAKNFKKNKDPWSAVNASSHYRKCLEAISAEKLLSVINIDRIKKPKLKSALYTTFGGVKRDLRRWAEALDFGEKAHALTPKDFRPCTLLGAVNMETGNYALGESWYKKAVERGFSENAVDVDLRKIFISADKSNRQGLKEYLLSIDPVRYRWTKTIMNKKQKTRKRNR